MQMPDPWLQNGYDIHVVFDTPQQEEAQDMMDRFLAFLRAQAIPFDRPILFEAPVGPWTTPMWQVLLNQPGTEPIAHHLGVCVGWLMANHGPLSVMIHPNSIDGGLRDHAEHAFWLGTPTPLKLDIFAPSPPSDAP